VSVDDLRDALYAAKIASYTQGFALLRAASEAYGYGTNLAEVARIWTAGCIIRAVFLDRIRAGVRGGAAPELLALAPDFTADLARRLPGWRRVVAAATAAGTPIPGLSASLGWFDTLTHRARQRGDDPGAARLLRQSHVRAQRRAGEVRAHRVAARDRSALVSVTA
jgi:6-phosphogluconate dehydrogenase